MIQLFSSDPAVFEGASVFVGTSVPVQLLFDYLSEGGTVSDFLEDHPSVSVEQIDGALEERELH